MKLPRNVPAERLIKALERIGYVEIRQKGSHVRMRNPGPPVHVTTIPVHRPIKIGTLHAILSEVAAAQSITIEAVLELL